MSIFQAPKVDEVDPDALSDPRDEQFFKELDRHFHPAISFEQELEIMQQEIFSRPEATWHHFTSNGIDADTGGPIIDNHFPYSWTRNIGHPVYCCILDIF